MGIKNSIWAILFLSVSVTAQTDTISNAFYKEFKNVIAVQAFSLNTFNNFTLNYQNENRVIEVMPNQKTTLGLAVQYNIISFSLGFAPRFLAENKDNKGSRMSSFSFTMLPGNFMFHFDYYNQKGITLAEEGGNSVYLQNLKTLKIGGNAAYFLNDNFSFSAAAFQNAKQLKSAGSFAPTLSFYYTEFNTKDEPAINDDKAYFIDIAVAPAYYYNWVINKNFLLSSGIAVGAGASTTVDDSSTTSFLINSAFHLATGYNGKRLFAGLNSRVMLFNHGSESRVEMNDAVIYASVFVGYRFDEPAFLKRKREKIEEKLNRLL